MEGGNVLTMVLSTYIHYTWGGLYFMLREQRSASNQFQVSIEVLSEQRPA